MNRIVMLVALSMFILTGCAMPVVMQGFHWTAPMHAPCTTARWVVAPPEYYWFLSDEATGVNLGAKTLWSADGECVVVSRYTEEKAKTLYRVKGVSLYEHEKIHWLEGREHPVLP